MAQPIKCQSRHLEFQIAPKSNNTKNVDKEFSTYKVFLHSVHSMYTNLYGQHFSDFELCRKLLTLPYGNTSSNIGNLACSSLEVTNFFDCDQIRPFWNLKSNKKEIVLAPVLTPHTVALEQKFNITANQSTWWPSWMLNRPKRNITSSEILEEHIGQP